MATTPNLGLYKPDRLDSVEVDVSLAQNFETIDTEVKGTKDRLDLVEAEITTLETSQIEASQKAQAAIDTVDVVREQVEEVERDVEILKASGGSGTGTPAFIDGGSFLDTYASQTTGLDGGEF